MHPLDIPIKEVAPNFFFPAVFYLEMILMWILSYVQTLDLMSFNGSCLWMSPLCCFYDGSLTQAKEKS